jgi:protein-S-isoprenylcysteine O-methyltransferase Ste14
MQQHRFSFPTRASLALPPAVVGSVLIIYILLTVGPAFLTPLSPLLALIGVCGIILVVLLFLWPRLALLFHVLIADTAIALPLGSSGISHDSTLGTCCLC